MKRGDIFYSWPCWWICHEKPQGKKLFILPLENLYKYPPRGRCSFYHEMDKWDVDKITVDLNLYDHPEGYFNRFDGVSGYEHILRHKKFQDHLDSVRK